MLKDCYWPLVLLGRQASDVDCKLGQELPGLFPDVLSLKQILGIGNVSDLFRVQHIELSYK
jgi:hypothetical protein